MIVRECGPYLTSMLCGSGSISHDPVIMRLLEGGPYFASMLCGNIFHDPVIVRLVESKGHIW